LDLYRGQYDFTNFTTQVHDFDPGIHPYPAGLFWTQTGIRLGGIDLEEGQAHMSASHLPERDFFNLPNALFRFQVPVSVEASASFDIHWSGPVTSRGPVTMPGTSGQLLMCQANMTWSASNSLGFKFVSHPQGTTSAFAQLGRVRNGVFIEQDGNDKNND
jgi:hypothetical protein